MDLFSKKKKRNFKSIFKMNIVDRSVPLHPMGNFNHNDYKGAELPKNVFIKILITSQVMAPLICVSFIELFYYLYFFAHLVPLSGKNFI